jgi:tetratricopeptide (TPR) repeat protein
MRQIKRGVRSEDEFLSTMEKLMRFIVQHKSTSIFIGVCAVVGIGLLVYFLSSGEKVEPNAELLYTQAIGLTSAGRFEEAENTFLQLTQNFQNTRPGKNALYFLGVICFHTARFDESLDHFDRFLTAQKNDYLLVPSALFGAACAAEGLKDYHRALSYYTKIVKDKKSPFYYCAMLAQGRLNGVVGNNEQAKEILNNLLRENPPLDVANDAKFYLGYFN